MEGFLVLGKVKKLNNGAIRDVTRSFYTFGAMPELSVNNIQLNDLWPIFVE